MKTARLFTIVIMTLLVSCGPGDNTGSEAETEGLTPVTVTHPSTGGLSEENSLNAVSKFLLTTPVKSDINGYIRKAQIHPGQKVGRGQELFIVKSKESEHLGNAILKLDTTFHFTGVVSIKSPCDGYVTELLHNAGDYVQDNEILASISDLNSHVFLLGIPYELINSIPDNKKPELLLPGGRKLRGTIASSLPAVDPASQTVSCIIHVNEMASIPENLVATVKFIKRSKSDATIVPKASVLTNEAQTEFWIMRMTDSTTAVKVPVTIGLETTDNVEIASPVLSASDLILLTGNYGLPDTAKVAVKNKK